ncbi:ATPase [Pelagibacterales bacterium SAG-MED15]|nr:ATPase [Pelagibacterales bacterium SAG-MED15]
MEIDSTFWVAVSFIIFILGLIYLKVPNKINELLNKMIFDIKSEIDESEKLRSESKIILDNAQNKLDSAKKETQKIKDQAKKDSENLIIEMNETFHKLAEIKKNLAQTKISQMKNNAIKDIKNTSAKIAIDAVKKILSTSVDKSKLENLFDKDLKEAKVLFKKINS